MLLFHLPVTSNLSVPLAKYSLSLHSRPNQTISSQRTANNLLILHRSCSQREAPDLNLCSFQVCCLVSFSSLQPRQLCCSPRRSWRLYFFCSSTAIFYISSRLVRYKEQLTGAHSELRDFPVEGGEKYFKKYSEILTTRGSTEMQPNIRTSEHRRGFHKSRQIILSK